MVNQWHACPKFHAVQILVAHNVLLANININCIAEVNKLENYDLSGWILTT